MQDFEMEFEQDTPDYDNDMFISSNGWVFSLSCSGKFIAEHEDQTEIEKIAKKWIAKNNYYPNIWFVSDHGNVTQYSL